MKDGIHQRVDQIRVVFDCSAKYKGVSLNDLLTGPDLTNSLAGVLCRFRQEPVALMCDVERMFHQFYVDPPSPYVKHLSSCARRVDCSNCNRRYHWLCMGIREMLFKQSLLFQAR